MLHLPSLHAKNNSPFIKKENKYKYNGTFIGFFSFFFERRGRSLEPRAKSISEPNTVVLLRGGRFRFRFICYDIYPIPPIPPAMITGCSCIRPASKTNRSHIYQQFKAAGRDCRCSVGFLRVSPDSYCGRYLDYTTPIEGSKDQSRKLHAIYISRYAGVNVLHICICYCTYRNR